MTEMSPAEAVFFAALEKASAAERAEYLNEACAGDPDLRARVERMLDAHPRAGGFLDSNGAGEITRSYEPLSEGPGTRVGPYKLLQQIGEGGMGAVFMAEQEEPVHRKVALKIIKPGMDSKQVVARFEAERQALAMMDHTNIAKVLDAGTTDSGRPYFVMELVHGVPITEYCDANKLTPRERLELFVPVCQAIQHAHQKGIIHRDVKPSNVLVTMYDDKPVPKVIDFGVAKAVEQKLTEKTLFTQYGALVGTFEYMSPEQAEMNAFGVDTRSDVYSLGVLLYELLTGTTPLERTRLREAAYGEIVRLIKEEEAPRPSVRLSTSNALAQVAAARKTDPAKLSSLVRGELDWIVMRCLEKDRTRRYDGASALARDVQRYLSGDAVEACPPTLGYRLWKAYRRNRVAVWVTAAFLLLLTAGVGGIYSAYQRAVAAESDARTEQENAEDERTKADEARRAAERTAANLQVDLDLAVYATDPERGLLSLARTLKGLPDDCQDLREFVVVALLAGGQEYAPLIRPLTHDGVSIVRHELSQDSRTLLTLGEDETARLWEVPTGRPIAILRREDERVVNCGFSTDGMTVFTDSRDGIARFWNVPEGSYLAQTDPRPDRYQFPQDVPSWGGVAYAALVAGDRLLTRRVASRDAKHGRDYSLEGPVELWDTRDGRMIARLDQPSHDVISFQFVAGGQWVATVEDRSTVLVFSAQNGQLAGRLVHSRTEDVGDSWNHSVTASPNGRWLMTRWNTKGGDSSDTYFRMWETGSWRPDPITIRGKYANGELRFLGEDVFACELYEWSGTSIFQRGRGEPVMTFDSLMARHDCHPIGHLMIDDRGNLVDMRTWQRLPPPEDRRFHLELARFAPDGRFVPARHLIDTRTDKEVVASLTPDGYFPGIGFIEVSRWGSDYGVELHLLAPTRLNLDPDLLGLWLQVALRGELGPDGAFVNWDEPTWERKQEELAAHRTPFIDFPFPGYVATDRLHWLRKEFAFAESEADALPLARELLRRAEAAGDQVEAVRWRAQVAKRIPEGAPPDGPKEP